MQNTFALLTVTTEHNFVLLDLPQPGILLGVAAQIANSEGLANAKFLAEGTKEFDTLRAALDQTEHDFAQSCKGSEIGARGVAELVGCLESFGRGRIQSLECLK